MLGFVAGMKFRVSTILPWLHQGKQISITMGCLNVDVYVCIAICKNGDFECGYIREALKEEPFK